MLDINNDANKKRPKNSENTEFVPKFREETAYSRRIKEFYKDVQVPNDLSSIGHLAKESKKYLLLKLVTD